ncbi:hypothetical protein [Calycomorphotria hydatis]|uniref:Lipoprotein n=1 Tax=Calycomorphotria hydatis TaxID=2528027 RepID=A0A517T6B1_9PLAN|nr:hypothetical protein [Calycomorphotria hydatis]QDT63909.1 hypothetical protein V22_11370 [Calycomorphotria hydatis]
MICCALIGCATDNGTTKLEHQLRIQEQQLYSLREKLSEAEQELNVAWRESDTLREQLAATGKPQILPEQADVLYRADRIVISKMLSGGLDADGQPGDELLIVHLAPLDVNGELLKLPGALEIEAIDPTLTGEARTVGHWTVSSEEAREYWQSGLLAAGFMLRLPWQRPVHGDKIMVTARMKTADGREFESMETIAVKPNMTSVSNIAETQATPVSNSTSQVSASSLFDGVE